MRNEKLVIGGIPALVWGEPSDAVYIHVHGKMSRKEYAAGFAEIAQSKGIQTLSFDLPEHGERAGQKERCDIWTGMRDLKTIADYVFAHWKKVSLFACSLGAYFALNTYGDMPLGKCLFQSPIVDMRYLVEMMMRMSDVTVEQLREKGEIANPIDTLRYDYYKYILAHPVTEWKHKTAILYAGKDELQTPASVREFCDRFGATLTVSPESSHPFMEEADVPIVRDWLQKNI